MLKRDAVISLAQIARWKSDGHAYPAFAILGRLAGYTEEQTNAAFKSHDKEPIIGAALNAK
jgi:hypothetical protein